MWSKGRSNEIWCFDHSSLSSSMKRVMAYLKQRRKEGIAKCLFQKGTIISGFEVITLVGDYV